jgi:predicted transcriptional regulator
MTEQGAMGEILKALEKGIVSSNALAVAAGLHHSTIASWRDGTSSPRLDTLNRAHQALLRLRKERSRSAALARRRRAGR